MAVDPGVGLVERYVELVNGGDFSGLGDIFAPDVVNHRPTGTEAGLGPLGAFLEAVRRALPDRVMRLDVVFADPAFSDGTRIGALVTQRGTSAQLGRPVTFHEVHLYRIVDGKIAELWFAVDRANFPAVVPADG